MAAERVRTGCIETPQPFPLSVTLGIHSQAIKWCLFVPACLEGPCLAEEVSLIPPVVED